MRRLKILHVEDNASDADLLVRACRAAGLPADFYEVEGGPQAMAYLTGAENFADRTRHPEPDLIVLDLRMPGMSGFELLKWLRNDSRRANIPVIVFTESPLPDDKIRALQEGATAYFVKPSDFESMVRLAETFKRIGFPGPNGNSPDGESHRL